MQKNMAGGRESISYFILFTHFTNSQNVYKIPIICCCLLLGANNDGMKCAKVR